MFLHHGPYVPSTSPRFLEKFHLKVLLKKNWWEGAAFRVVFISLLLQPHSNPFLQASTALAYFLFPSSQLRNAIAALCARAGTVRVPRRGVCCHLCSRNLTEISGQGFLGLEKLFGSRKGEAVAEVPKAAQVRS